MNIKGRFLKFIFVTLRIKKYQFLSDCKRVEGNLLMYHPVLLKGPGRIVFGKNVQVGVISSPNYYTHYAYFEAKSENSEIIIGNNTAINNGFSAIALSKISIGNNVLIGVNCSVIDSDGHLLDPQKRNHDLLNAVDVNISNNVFIGSNVVILKGVTIGENSVIGNGSVVTKNIPANVIAAGNPARVIRSL
ncbi:acyltransferase [Flavobacterium sp. Sd200]|uniref:DapH/DapD/GlmU-related protein n=1 Tax=Flavobacterium sp. Sd200 TaxID=2692211 RepID=UPI00136D7C8A|nr:DapH/DapD/GlmU-related protein [Flavobacterium sp. Sd200]MXN92935.1 acyltransferase [Flavobacterium sp. Sd200]